MANRTATEHPVTPFLRHKNGKRKSKRNQEARLSGCSKALLGELQDSRRSTWPHPFCDSTWTHLGEVTARIQTAFDHLWPVLKLLSDCKNLSPFDTPSPPSHRVPTWKLVTMFITSITSALPRLQGLFQALLQGGQAIFLSVWCQSASPFNMLQ